MSSLIPVDLFSALENGEIVPWFQPIVDLRSGFLSGFEVLARWRHPQHGMVSPTKFIPLAEGTGLIEPLMDVLLAQAFEEAALLPKHLTLSVNISPVQLRNRLLPTRLQRAVERGNFSFRQLIVEITESALMLNFDLGRRIANEMKTLGAQLALDDFGTGYSSLRHLHALPFDKIKIDASFVQSMTSQRESRKIVAAVVGLGISLGLETVGEGIEEKEQADLLYSLGCNLGQGWLYGRPMPGVELAGFLRDDVRRTKQKSDVSGIADVALNIEALPAQRLAQLQAIYDGAPVGLSFLDTNLRYVSMNERSAAMRSIPVQDHIGRSVAELIPDAFPVLEPVLQRALQGEAISGVEFQLPNQSQNGGYTTVLGFYQPIRDEADEIVGISAATVDITDRKHLEGTLAESKEHYRRIVELISELLWIADSKGMMTDVDSQWEALTGQSKEEALGRGWIKAVHPLDAARTAQAWQEAVLSGRPYDIDYRCGRGDGSWRWMRARAMARRRSNGEIIQWYGVLEDIDDRKKAEEALRSSGRPTPVP
jgi:PAS domain S-box-containing protein